MKILDKEMDKGLVSDSLGRISDKLVKTIKTIHENECFQISVSSKVVIL